MMSKYRSSGGAPGAGESVTGGFSEMMDFGRTIVSSDDVMDGVAEMVPVVHVEATFPDGTKLVTCHDPIAPAVPA